VEYAWILVLVSVVAVLLLRVIGGTTNNLLADTNANMPR
jgi:Flp pilus assembly pilin Flp